LTGFQDYYEDPVDEPEKSAHCTGGNLQEQKLFQLLQGYNASTRSLINASSGLIVQAIAGDVHGGLQIDFSDNVSLTDFPAQLKNRGLALLSSRKR
jgi:hypothetical protein